MSILFFKSFTPPRARITGFKLSEGCYESIKRDIAVNRRTRVEVH
jgi:hypothetical protein